MNLEIGSSNPIALNKYITFINTTTDLCDIQNLKKQFSKKKKTMIEIFKKSANVKLKCPFEKKIYRTSDWLIDAD
jgi:hypothetical protein